MSSARDALALGSINIEVEMQVNASYSEKVLDILVFV